MPRLILLITLCAALQVRGEDSGFDLLTFYKHLHQYPELSFQEEKTSATIASELRAAGYQVTEGVGGYGVVAVLRNGDGPTLMLRMDTDALPVSEPAGVAWASKARATEQNGQEVDVMHACGHDIHMSVVTATARQMAQRKGEWSGTLMVIAQPAEERGAGARLMLADGLFERFPRPDYNLSLHTISTLPAGTVGYVSGWMMANVDMVDITIPGVGGHGAYPHTTRDPVVLAAAIIMDLQTLVSRSIHPTSPAVVTVGSMHAGTKHNIIPDEARLQITVRSYSDEVRQTLLSGIKRISANQARAFDFPDDLLPRISVRDEYTPALWNDPALVERGVAAMRAALGQDKVVKVTPEMGGEDFARYGRTTAKIPGFMIRLGSVPQATYDASERGEVALPSLHSPLFFPDPLPTLETGVTAMTAMAMDILGSAN